MSESNQNQAHPFQSTLGLGPYRLVGFFALQLPSEANQGRNNFHLAPKVERGIGTCAHCGHAIVNIYIVSIGDGKRFGVGSDCILKVGLPAKEMTELNKIKREHDKVLRKARKDSKGDKARAELQSLIDQNSVRMSSFPHPAISHLTLLDYAKWTIENSNSGGIVFALKRVSNILQDMPK